MNHVSSASDEVVPLVWEQSLDEGTAVDEYVRHTMSFWTKERLKLAVPKPLEIIDALPPNIYSNAFQSSNENVHPTVIPATFPDSSMKLNRVGYPVTVGKVFYQIGSSVYSCSGSVITSKNKDMIATAGHCGYSTESSSFAKSLIFIPQYENATFPYGIWTARSIIISESWSRGVDYSFDVAFVRLYSLNTALIEDVVGSQAIGFNHPHSGLVYSFGYPNNYAEGEIMTFCSATKYDPDLPQYTVDAMSCIMNEGSSGGPWLESYTSTSLSGVQTSVNSFLLKSTPNVVYGPYFGSNIQTLYNIAQGYSAASTLSKSYIFTTMGILFLSTTILS